MTNDTSASVPSVGAADGVHERRAALGQVQTCRAEHHGVGAGEHHIGVDGAGRDVQHALVRVGDAGEHDGAAGPDVDRRSGGVVPHHQPGLTRGNGGDVVGVRGDRRLAVGGQVRDQRVAVAAGQSAVAVSSGAEASAASAAVIATA